MRLPDRDDGPEGINFALAATIMGVVLFVIVLIILILITNNPKPGKNNNESMVERQESTTGSYPDTYEIIGTGETSISPDDFDFWDLYPVESVVIKEESSTLESTVEEEPDPATDGKHTGITKEDGSTEWIMINPYLDKNEYDDTKFVNQSGILKYYEDGRPISYFGVDISKTQAYVDFIKLKKAGVNFVMIRLGARGYETGQIVLDEYFADNMKRATDAGLDVGVYFFSQAINEEEIAEEADFVLQNLEGYELKYPVAFVMEYVANDHCRVEDVSKKDKTQLAISFMDVMKLSGYHTVLYGNKEWLLKEVDLSKLKEYDIWYSGSGDLPDYPYDFTMWQYNKAGEVDGVLGTVNFNISFIDYSEK